MMNPGGCMHMFEHALKSSVSCDTRIYVHFVFRMRRMIVTVRAIRMRRKRKRRFLGTGVFLKLLLSFVNQR